MGDSGALKAIAKKSGCNLLVLEDSRRHGALARIVTWFGPSRSSSPFQQSSSWRWRGAQANSGTQVCTLAICRFASGWFTIMSSSADGSEQGGSEDSEIRNGEEDKNIVIEIRFALMTAISHVQTCDE